MKIDTINSGRFNSVQTIRPNTTSKILGAHVLKSIFFSALVHFSDISAHGYDVTMQSKTTKTQQNALKLTE